MSNSNSISPHHTDINQDFGGLSQMSQNPLSVHDQPPQKAKKKRNLPGNPDPDAEVIALSPKSLLATNRFVCEICNKGFQRDQNLQLHRRGHNLPWKLRQTRSKENKKRAYVCPELSCVHHDPSRALGDLTGIKKHYCRKHGEKKWKCDKCTKIYAVKSDWKAHSKACGTKEYKCDCGSIFPRKDSYITHKAFCEALSKENGKISTAHITHSMPSSSLFPPNPNTNHTAANHPQLLFGHPNLPPPPPITNSFAQFSPFNNRRFPIPYWDPTLSQNPNNPNILVAQNLLPVKHEPLYQERSFLPPLSATALLHRAMGSVGPSMGHADAIAPATWRATCGGLTRDFLGLTGEQCDGDGGSGGSTGGAAAGFPQCDRDGPVFGG